MKICLKAGGVSCIAASVRFCVITSPPLLLPRRKHLPITLHGRVSPTTPSNGGARPATTRYAARPSRKQYLISARPSKWRITLAPT